MVENLWFVCPEWLFQFTATLLIYLRLFNVSILAPLLFQICLTILLIVCLVFHRNINTSFVPLQPLNFEISILAASVRDHAIRLCFSPSLQCFLPKICWLIDFWFSFGMFCSVRSLCRHLGFQQRFFFPLPCGSLYSFRLLCRHLLWFWLDVLLFSLVSCNVSFS
jgi:hypothetical protein